MSGNGGFTSSHLVVKQVYSNTEQKLIQIPEDKLKLILTEHSSSLEKKGAWVAPLSILITILAVFATTEFKAFYFDAATWRAFFLFVSLATFLWLLKTLKHAFGGKSIDDVIDTIKGEDNK
ncbi:MULTISPECIES: hypothetical protein [Vibrio]|uniref:hypothetical protein n=1 Tax=Vibrio TaxID=662 RepID=UPI00057FC294|nr:MULTISPECIES: hypothetical protein [Vibrio]KIE18855.1 hypothetical protein SE23_20120 [Vibrio sinaloensis]MBF4453667.1 hypothetical protein [Vibrio vulnificus]MBF4499445.1 hypothetical protein [Vibrio vulnificus]MBL6179016.1 hypothetical protein [Vibrio vulnificus]HDY7983727.1 hypothetical protein [Vibrio vulnificus]